MQVPPVPASAPARGCDLLLPKLLTLGVWLLALYLLAHSSAALAQARSSCRGYHPPASDELVSESRTWGREKRSHPNAPQVPQRQRRGGSRWSVTQPRGCLCLWLWPSTKCLAPVLQRCPFPAQLPSASPAMPPAPKDRTSVV